MSSYVLLCSCSVVMVSYGSNNMPTDVLFWFSRVCISTEPSLQSAAGVWGVSAYAADQRELGASARYLGSAEHERQRTPEALAHTHFVQQHCEDEHSHTQAPTKGTQGKEAPCWDVFSVVCIYFFLYSFLYSCFLSGAAVGWRWPQWSGDV